MFGIPITLISYAVIAVLAIGGIAWMVHQHDANILAQQKVESQAVEIATLNADHTRVVAALESVSVSSAQIASSSADIRNSVHAHPSISACMDSPAIRDAITGLRNRNTADSSTPKHTGQSISLQSRASIIGK